MCLWYQGIDNDDGGGVRVRRARRLSDDNGGVGRGRGIEDASEGLETRTEMVGAMQRGQGIYSDDGGARKGR